MLPTLPLLCCPSCHANIEIQQGSANCRVCQRHYPLKDGVIDFLPEYAGSKKFLQWAMERRFIVEIYENAFRPLFTRFFSKATVDYAKESKWLDDVMPTNVTTVLDLAAGTGRYIQEAATLRHPQTIIAMDISLPMLAAAKRQNESLGIHNVIYVRADAHRIPVGNGVIDVVLCFGALHLFDRPTDALGEVARSLAPGGIFAGLTAGSDGKNKGQEAIFSRLLSWTFFDESCLRKILSGHAMSLQRFDLSNFVLLLAAQKFKS